MRAFGLSLVLAGWLAQLLASTHDDVDRSVEAYGESRYEEALAALDEAIEELGDRPELLYDRGLILLAQGEAEAAKTAFERGSEAEETAVKGSSHYELGNLALDAEDWDGAIAGYIACLRAVPGHENAKWNLEIAYARKRAEEEKKQDEEKPDEEQEDEAQEGDSDEGSEGPEGTDEGTDSPEQGSEGGDEAPPEDGEGGDSGTEQEPEAKPEPETGNAEPPPAGEDSGDKGESAPAQEIDRADIDAALEQLDQQDAFMMGRPGASQPVAKDW